MPEQPQSAAELLARIKPVKKSKRVQLCLRPDLLEAWEAADQELVQSRVDDQASQRLASGKDSAKTKKLAERVQELEAEIDANALWFTVEAMSKDEFAKLTEAHPPRKGNDIDAYVGYDRGAVFDAAVRPSIVDPVFDDASWAQFVSICNPSEWQELSQAVEEVNGSVTTTPKSSLAASVLTRRAVASK